MPQTLPIQKEGSFCRSAQEISKILSRSADKKGSNVPIVSAAQVISHTYGHDFEQLPTSFFGEEEERTLTVQLASSLTS